jgi:Uma2 family endonuclease
MICMQATAALMPVEEYLATSFEGPDREYVDGIVVERNVGELDHANTQGELVYFFRRLREKLGTWAFPELRVQVLPTRFRVPDVCVTVGPPPAEPVLRTAPFLVIQILSPDDRASELQENIDEYLAFGVRFVWVIDPRTRRGYVHTADGSREAKDGVLRTADPAIELPLEQLWTL